MDVDILGMEAQPAERGKLTGIIGVLIVVLLVIGLFFQRSRSAAGQGAAFHAGEAGVHYVLHLLNSGTCTPAELFPQSLAQVLASESGAEPIGMFQVTFEPAPAAGVEHLRLRVLGREEDKRGLCQSIEADIEPFTGAVGIKYRLVSWEHEGAARCGPPAEPREIFCAGRDE